ncbi:hypothetical protein SAMN05443144_12171 [Fodinibius roseus]|uniref:Uncharacterized protein n=1 Tax=Fodinibius roseus TaxID=1194090 RepID=A0A1M5HYW5_9BACT|nr:hypothetical protein [Fodinibius roseus]SHG20999.1 hypothetical protein SAMN05443144_12171 [Fodinibius roseus]
MNSIYFFYSRYVNGLSSERALQGDYPLAGNSPFGDGDIMISEDGTYKCKATGRGGAPEAFLAELFPLLTDEGVAKAIAVESTDEYELHPRRCKDQLTRFRESEDRQLDFEYLTGLEGEQVTDLPLWADGKGKRLYYLHYSGSGKPICNISWRPGARNETIVGVPRLQPAPGAERLWMVENPLQAKMIEWLLDEPAYLRPTAQALRWNDYEKLSEGKTVVLLMGNDRGDWEHSFYPLLKSLYSRDIPVKAVSAPALTGGEPVVPWLAEKESKSILLEEVEKAKPGRLSSYDKKTYHESIIRPGPKSLYFPLDTGRDMLWYGLKNGEVAHSQPVNVLDVDELPKMHGLETEASATDSNFRLTRAEVFNIVNARPQLTPRRTFESLRDFILDYFYFEHDQMASLIALWIMGTYVYRLFPAYGYLHFNGRYDTGKSSLLKLISMCGFNGLFQSQATKAATVNRIDRLGGTICFDEYEKASSGTGDEFVQMINSGYKKSGRISKMVGNKEVSLHSYSPKAFGGIDDITADALKSRMITINTVPMPPTAIKKEWSDIQKGLEERGRQIRRGGYALGLFHHETIHRYYRRLPRIISLANGHTLTSRQRELMRPLIAIARLVDTGGKAIAEPVLMKAFALSLELGACEQATREDLLAQLLNEWSNNPHFTEEDDYYIKGNEVRIVNDHWEKTELEKHAGGKRPLLKWFRDTYNIKTSIGTRMKKRGTSKSCTVFPVDINVNGKPFTDWFTP